MILLTDEEIASIVFGCNKTGKAARHEVNKAQLKKVAKDLTNVLEDPAYFNHRQAKIWEYVEALLKEVE